MTKVNVVFDDELADVDIILVPDEIASNIEAIVQSFFNWAFEPENKPQFMKRTNNGRMVMSLGTHELIWWLNKYRIVDGPKAAIIMEHTTYCADYPSAEF